VRALIVLNHAARRHEALRRYARVRDVVEAGLDGRVVALDAGGAWRRILDAALRDGVRLVVAAGGDGTVNAVANALVERAVRVPLEDICFGAVGLGSSNDFQKPARTVAQGVPIRVGFSDCAPRDVARAVWTDEEGIERSRCFVVSASLGATAAANRRFSDSTAMARALGALWVDAAIAWAAARTLASHRNVEATMAIGDETHRFELSNLNVMKTAHLSGSFCYDTPIDPSSGLLGVNLCHGMGRARLLWTLVSLLRGRFAGLPRTRHWSGDHAEIALAEPGDLELDGELFRARRVRFEVLREQLMVCS